MGEGVQAEGMGSRLGRGEGEHYPKRNSFPSMLALPLCPSSSCRSPRAETHTLVLSSSPQPQRTQGPVGDPPSSRWGIPRIQTRQPCTGDSLFPYPLAPAPLLKARQEPPASLTLLPHPSISVSPSLPPGFHHPSLPFPPQPGPGTQTPAQGHKAPIDFCPNSTC